MRIDPSLFVAPVTSETAAKPHANGPRASGPSSVVALSSAGAAVVADTEDGPPSPRVEKLKMMVEAGAYKVDLDTLASRIVDDEVVRGSR
jgi:anti-sigma28 factor (negative regulator of flagellin synthesis)